MDYYSVIANGYVCEKVQQTFVFLKYPEFFTLDVVTILHYLFADTKHAASRAPSTTYVTYLIILIMTDPIL